tara:strand:- start:531 stop:1013 length:483 start_codon:yes stop_codon:yes gene_type:complete
MKNLSKQINDIIKEELSIINKKINGPVLLEILKYKIIEKIKINNLSINPVNIIGENDENILEDDLRNITVKLILYKSPLINLNSIIKNNKLIICLNEILNIDIENTKLKKIFNFKCAPMTGVIIPEESKCSFNYPKNSIILELSSIDKLLNIEKSKESTI